MGSKDRSDSRGEIRPWVIRVTAIISMGLLLIGCTSTPPPTGTLRGHVTIGPLVPVLQEGEVQPTPAPEVYAARKIRIFKFNGATLVAEVEINAQGNYAVELPAGSYLVDINHFGIDTAASLPAEVLIQEGAVTTLDVAIDTGMR